MISVLVIPSPVQEKSELGVTLRLFPMPPQGVAPPATAPAGTPLSSTSSTGATPASYHTKSEPRGLSVFKQEKQKVCFRELSDTGVC